MAAATQLIEAGVRNTIVAGLVSLKKSQIGALKARLRRGDGIFLRK
jgi:hypothetical protein